MKKACPHCKVYTEVGTVIQRQFIKVEGGRAWGVVCVDICTRCGNEIDDEEQKRLDREMLEEMRRNVMAFQHTKGA